MDEAPKQEELIDEGTAWEGLANLARDGHEDLINSINLRPDSFTEYVGQEATKENLRIACQAAMRRKEPLDHILLHGPPGLGKTSLARIIARELNVNFKATSGPVIEKPGDLAAILTQLQPMDVLFIDEIHRLPRVVEEVLYSAMEDFKIDIMIGQGPAARSIKLDLKPFTLIGATTRTGSLTFPLRDRFGMILRLEYYSFEELTKIVLRTAKLLSTEIVQLAAEEIGRRARGTPRIANRIFKRVRDFAQERGNGLVDQVAVEGALKLLQIDGRGLDKMDRTILSSIIEKFDGGPVGIDTIATIVGEERETVEDVYEPFLVQEGFLMRTKRGREAARLAYEHLKLKQPASKNPTFF